MITIGRFDLTLRVKEPIIFPAYQGSTLRGGFGNAFKQTVCIQKNRECSQCLLKEKCIYSYVFETPPPSDTKVMRKYQAAPRPFIIEPPPGNKRVYKPEDRLTFGLTLIGKAFDYLPYFIYTFDRLGEMGIGKGRGKFTLESVRSHKNLPHIEEEEAENIIYSSGTRKLESSHPIELSVDKEPSGSKNPDLENLTLSFLTPARIYFNEKLTLDLEFHIFFRNLLRRISLLSYFHCGIDPELWNFTGYINQAKAVKVKKNRLRWYNWERYSTRQEQKIHMGGFIGEITFSGNIDPFMSLIRAGEILHVGKGTVFGMGGYEVVGKE